MWGFSVSIHKQVRAVIERRDAIHHAAVRASAFAELVEVGRQALRAHQLAVALQHDIVRLHRVDRNFLAIQERIVTVAEVAFFFRVGDLLRQARAERIRAGDDDAVFHAQFHEGVPASADFGDKILMGHRHLAVLMAALFLIGNLVFDLQRARTGLDHLLGEQVGCFGVAETGVDVGDDRHDMGFVFVDGHFQPLGFQLVAGLAGTVQLAKHAAELTGIGLTQECVEFLDQSGHGGFLVHRLVGQGAELGAQCGNHPAGQIQVTALGGAEMLLDGNHLLLADEAVPAPQRLGVVGRVGIIGRHVIAHDLRRIAGDVEAGLEAVLQPHPRDRISVDGSPRRAGFRDGTRGGRDFLGVGHEGSLLLGLRPIGGARNEAANDPLAAETDLPVGRRRGSALDDDWHHHIAPVAFAAVVACGTDEFDRHTGIDGAHNGMVEAVKVVGQLADRAFLIGIDRRLRICTFFGGFDRCDGCFGHGSLLGFSGFRHLAPGACRTVKEVNPVHVRTPCVQSKPEQAVKGTGIPVRKSSLSGGSVKSGKRMVCHNMTNVIGGSHG